MKSVITHPFILFLISDFELPISGQKPTISFELACTIDGVFIMLDEGMYFEVMVIFDGDIFEKIDG